MRRDPFSWHNEKLPATTRLLLRLNLLSFYTTSAVFNDPMLPVM
jgi:hypothetical protein